MILSKNFKLSEFERSEKAVEIGVKNKAPKEVISNIKILVDNLLQPFLNYTGWHNRISSGYRNATVNKAVGGSKTSQHLIGEASDNNHYYFNKGGAKVNVKPIEVLRTLLDSGLDFDQCILYNSFVHLSYTSKRKNRKQILYNKSYSGERLK